MSAQKCILWLISVPVTPYSDHKWRLRSQVSNHNNKYLLIECSKKITLLECWDYWKNSIVHLLLNSVLLTPALDQNMLEGGVKYHYLKRNLVQFEIWEKPICSTAEEQNSLWYFSHNNHEKTLHFYWFLCFLHGILTIHFMIRSKFKP